MKELNKGDKVNFEYPGIKLVEPSGTENGVFIRPLKNGHVEVKDSKGIIRWIHESQIINPTIIN